MMETILVLAPFAAAAFAGLLQRYIGDKVAMSLTTGAVGLSAALSLYVFADLNFMGGLARTFELFRFVDIAGFTSTWSVRIDALSSVMLVVVTSVAFLVHVYSWGYMADDPHRARFFAYLSFFTFSMLALVTANDFLQLFFGWEGVGVASYLLIGFWYKKRSANDAAIKAFVTNRVGDFGFALGIMAAFYAYGSIEFDAVFKAAAANPGMMFQFGPVTAPAIEIICGLLFIGAMGKSAQFFLHVWLPDAMEGPTPVSALIHAATMVTAGVFLVCRCSSMFEMAPVVAGGVTLIGAVTAIFAATCGLAQNDIKRVIAYSTCSQLGYMFFAAGVGAYGAAMFHLFTHAFFKALLFLGAGSVIHGMHHEQDMRFMGGVRKAMPITWAMMLVGTLALIGFGLPLEHFKVGFAGFWSKDHIIESTFVAGENGRAFGQFAFVISLLAALLTSFYSWRLLFMTFEGRHRPNPDAHHDDHAPAAHGAAAHAHDDGHGGHAHDDKHAHAPAAAGVAPAHESPWVMVVPLIVLAVGAVLAGGVFHQYFVGAKAAEFWNGTLALQHDPLGASAHHGAAGEGGHHALPAWVIWGPFGVTLAGFLIALPIYFFSSTAGAAIAKATGPLHAFLSRKWYFDELYDFVFVKGARALGDLFWKVGDRRIIDGLGPNGFAAAARFSAQRLRKLQTGYLYHYSFLMLAAAVAFGAYALWASGLLKIAL